MRSGSDARRMVQLDPARYYADLTPQYARYAGRARGWHHGIWEPDVRTHAGSLLRSNEILLRGLDVGPRTEILDVGFGAGGFAVWAARRFGCRVTGVSLCREHVPLAARLAASAGVGDRCRFLVMDMDRLGIRDASFDVVVNQETFCHAQDKARYLAAAFDLLRPGGSWRAVDFSVQAETLSPEQEDAHETVRRGFHLAPLVPAAETRRLLAAAGFVDVAVHDVTAETARSAELILGRCRIPLLLMRLDLDWLIFSRHAKSRTNRRGHTRAAEAYSTGLLQGHFRHVVYTARKP
jgi:cyclopropane fatty-acyl-phospholipid synthase-like methyltransferase